MFIKLESKKVKKSRRKSQLDVKGTRCDIPNTEGTGSVPQDATEDLHLA